MTNLSGINLNNGSAVGSKREGMDSPSQSLALMSKYDAYKNSGVEWLGDIPSSWMLKRFKHHYRSAMGETILASDLVVDGSIPVFSATEGSHFFGYVNSSGVILERGDLVIPARGNSIGFPKLVDQKSTCSQTTIYAKQIKKISQSFCFYYLLGCKPYLFQFVQTAIPQITVDEVKNNWLVVPSIEEQTRIANFLDKKTAQIDEAIAIKEKQISLLKERKQIIIQQAVTQGLDPNVPMKDSGVDWMGKIPQHWKLKPNKCLFKLKKSLVGKRSGDYELLSLTLKGIIKRDMDNPEGKFPAEFNTYQEVSVGDFVFCLFDVEETPRTVGLSKFNGMITGAYTVFELDESVSKEFIYYFYLNLDSRKMMRPLYKGLRNTISKETFLSFKSFIPPLKEQEEIVDFIEYEVNKIDLTIDGISEQIDKIKEYKSCLINGSVTGKIKVTSEMVEQ
ncbi:restriction endonuclease subunit S [Shewanella indica]|uniref:restriction endonuclease subunit S n=1 Tax=Shewanella indica TaxID=768528 RepID=UPI003004BE33